MKKRSQMKKRGIIGLLLVVMLIGAFPVGAADDLYYTYDPVAGQFSKEGSTIKVNADSIVEMAVSYNPTIASYAYQRDNIKMLTMFGGSSADRTMATVYATEYSLTNAIGKMSYAAQTMLFSCYTLENRLKSLDLDMKEMANTKIVMKKQMELGMISQDEYAAFLLKARELEVGRQELAVSLENLREKLGAYISRDMSKIEIEAFALLTKTEIGARLEKVEKAELKDAKLTSMDINAARLNTVATNNAYDERVANLAYLEAENNHAAAFQTYKNDTLLAGEKLNAAIERYARQERDFAVVEKQYALGMVSKMEFESAKNQLDKGYLSLVDAHITFDSNYRKFIALAEKGIAV